TVRAPEGSSPWGSCRQGRGWLLFQKLHCRLGLLRGHGAIAGVARGVGFFHERCSLLEFRRPRSLDILTTRGLHILTPRGMHILTARAADPRQGVVSEKQVSRASVQRIQSILRAGHGHNLKSGNLQRPLQRTPKNFVVVDKPNMNAHRAPQRAREMPEPPSTLSARLFEIPGNVTSQSIGIRTGAA